ncbi:recombinase family protein [Arenibacter sp. TNZ]|uniref:recombinase family protein n=1 Tax=Arenibacter TaxID=178469 RepID=UPI000CD46D3D|nr:MULTISPECIES: recombinase family protein [Arenibacter]MCM4171873.1 recombinase family protein [Arenibacter sp. TNZ]
MKVFYSRVSTEEQSDSRQLKNTERGFDYVISDKCSGAIPLWERPRGKQIKELIDKGELNELHVHSIDRLGRNTIDVLSRWKELTELGIRVVCRNPNLQNINDEGNVDSFSEMMVSILSMMGKFEKDMIDMRRTEGIERTKQLEPWKYSGRKIGTNDSPIKFLNKPKSKDILKDLERGYGVREISNMRDCSFSTIYKVINLNEQINQAPC